MRRRLGVIDVLMCMRYLLHVDADVFLDKAEFDHARGRQSLPKVTVSIEVRISVRITDNLICYGLWIVWCAVSKNTSYIDILWLALNKYCWRYVCVQYMCKLDKRSIV